MEIHLSTKSGFHNMKVNQIQQNTGFYTDLTQHSYKTKAKRSSRTMTKNRRTGPENIIILPTSASLIQNMVHFQKINSLTERKIWPWIQGPWSLLPHTHSASIANTDLVEDVPAHLVVQQKLQLPSYGPPRLLWKLNINYGQINSPRANQILYEKATQKCLLNQRKLSHLRPYLLFLINRKMELSKQ